MKADELLSKAAQHMQDRAATYDKPEGERSMGKAVQAFNAITGRDLTEPEGWLLLQVLKDVRLFQRPGYHADSAEDCIAYAALKAEAKAGEAVPAGDADGWIAWCGGDCPVPDKLVWCKFSGGGAIYIGRNASNLRWSHTGDYRDIIAYRVVPTHG
jgi:hypothetical protein